MESQIPTSWQGILWSRGISGLNWQKDRNYIIHQVLMYGSLDDIQVLFAQYGKKEIVETFKTHPKKIYSPQAFNFISRYLLGLRTGLKQELYVRKLY